MTRFSLFLVLVFFAILGAFAVYNHDLTTIQVPFDKVYEVPKVGIILFSAICGGFLILVLYMLRDTRRFMDNYQLQKKQKKGERVEAGYSKALAAILANDREEARVALEKVLKEEPGHVESLLRLGEISSASGKHEESIQHFRKCLELPLDENKRMEALLLLEKEMQWLSRWNEALQSIDQILAIDPDSLSALERKCQILEVLERWDDLVDTQKKILQHPHVADFNGQEAKLHGFKYELGRQNLEAGKLEPAGKVFRSVLKYDRNFIPAYLGSAEVLIGTGENEEAIDFLEKGYLETGSLIILARLEDLLISIGDPDRAIKIYQDAIARNQDNIDLKFLLGKLYYRLEMVDDALEVLRRLQGSDADPVLYSMLGELHMRREAYEKAARSFRKAIGTKPWKLIYACDLCGHSTPDWAGRCPVCANWGTFSFGVHGRAKV